MPVLNCFPYTFNSNKVDKNFAFILKLKIRRFVLPDVDGMFGGQVDVVGLEVLLVADAVLVVAGLLKSRQLLFNAVRRAARSSIAWNLI